MQTEKIIQIGVLLLAFHALILYFLYKQLRYMSGLVEDLEEDLREMSISFEDSRKNMSPLHCTSRFAPFSSKIDTNHTNMAIVVIDHRDKCIHSSYKQFALKHFLHFHFSGKVDDYYFVETIPHNTNWVAYPKIEILLINLERTIL